MHNFYSDHEVCNLGFKQVGANVKISRNAKFYGSEYMTLDDNVRIDDFAIISTQSDSSIGKHVHISTGVFITSRLGFNFGDYSGVSAKCSLYGDSDDYTGKFMSNPTFSPKYRLVTSSPLVIEKYGLIGSNSVMLPNSKLSEGSVLGSMSLLNKVTMPWVVYFGIPARAINDRKKDLLRFIEDFE